MFHGGGADCQSDEGSSLRWKLVATEMTSHIYERFQIKMQISCSIIIFAGVWFASGRKLSSDGRTSESVFDSL